MRELRNRDTSGDTADRGDGAADAQIKAPQKSDLGIRAASAVVLAPVAIGAAWFGGLPFLILCALAAIGIWWEWAGLSVGAAALRLTIIGVVALVAAAVFLALGWFGTMIWCLVVAAILVSAQSRAHPRPIIGAGILYAGTMLFAPVLLRNDPRLGVLAIIFLFAVVWTTDIAAYFAGRAIGGPKLAPSLSPKKTWSGALGGAGGAVIAATVVALVAGLGQLIMVALVGLGLSVASQAGDLFESALKRHYGAKDAGHLIPGHGGLMDRLDGFIAAALVAVIIGLARGGAEAPARGLLVW